MSRAWSASDLRALVQCLEGAVPDFVSMDMRRITSDGILEGFTFPAVALGVAPYRFGSAVQVQVPNSRRVSTNVACFVVATAAAFCHMSELHE